MLVWLEEQPKTTSTWNERLSTPEKVVVDMSDLSSISSESVRGTNLRSKLLWIALGTVIAVLAAASFAIPLGVSIALNTPATITTTVTTTTTTPVLPIAVSSAPVYCGCGTISVSLTNILFSTTGVTYQWQSSPTNLNIWTNISSVMTSSSFTIPTPASSTDYQCQIVTPSPTSMIFTSTIVTVTVGVVYCAPTVVRCDDGDTINNFILLGESGTKINDIETNCSVNSYDNRTSQSITLFNGMVYTALVSSQYSPGEQFEIWIDFNNNKVFESNESVTYGLLNSTYDTPVVLTIPTASSGGTPGIYRMRAVVAYGNTPNPCNPSYTYGETHDYTVNIISYTPCTSSFCQSTLLLSDTNTATVQTLVNNLQSSGLIVNYIPGGISSYTGSPPASAYGSVILVPGDIYSTDMPISGQQSIVNAQKTSGTGVVMTEWAAYQVSNGRWSILSSLLLATLTTTSSGYVSYTLIIPAHPIWTGVANSFSTSVTITFARLNTPTTGSIIIANCSSCSSAAVIARHFGGTIGRIVQIGHAGHYSGTSFNWANDGNLLQMMRNAVRWAAKLI